MFLEVKWEQKLTYCASRKCKYRLTLIADVYCQQLGFCG
jgi:hypothetical protein